MATLRSSISLFFARLVFLLTTFLTCYAQIQSSSSFTLKQGQDLKASNASTYLLSSNGVFKLGFFNPGVTSVYNRSSYSYLAIWYDKTPNNPEAVWVANRADPILDSSGVLALDSDGNLKITSRDMNTIVLNSNAKVSADVAAFLLDSGNFVLSETTEKGEPGRVLWQSFDNPTDTLLPDMKLGIDLRTGQRFELSSWLTGQVPSIGAFRLGVDPGDANQLVLWRRDEVYWTSGEWQNGSFTNALNLTKRDDLFEFRFVSNEVEKYFTYSSRNSSILSRWEVNVLGQIVRFGPDKNGTTSWESEVTNPCEPMRYPETMCIGLKSTRCRSGSAVFVKRRGRVRTYNSMYIIDDSELSLTDCQATCWNDCDCACAATLYPNGTACIAFTDIADITFDEISSTYAYFPTSESTIEGTPNEEGTERDSTGNSTIRKWWVWCVIVVSITCAIMLVSYYFYYSRKAKLRLSREPEREGTSENTALFELRSRVPSLLHTDRGGKTNKNYELFSFPVIESSTENFSVSNKLGQGGFGPVYKGTLQDGKQIAIKRLSRGSGQGLEEFMNEITLIAELQHTNLVRLFGCCIQGEEKMLVYEYMPNKSLDYFLFAVDPMKRKLLDWEKRFNVIEGIAQGILYLHKYSRLRIIHRDLKASNILLDQDMNPKISDFGIARIFGRNESSLNTMRIVGTYGYMPPEYAMSGVFSVKSDVYSFGILLLEIVSGKKNNNMSLLELAWDLWRKGETRALAHESMGVSSCPQEEVVKRVHISLLCVQEHAEDRPTMSTVVAMLSSDAVNLPDPKQPSYCGQRGRVVSLLGIDLDSGVASTNGLTMTAMEPR